MVTKPPHHILKHISSSAPNTAASAGAELNQNGQCVLSLPGQPPRILSGQDMQLIKNGEPGNGPEMLDNGQQIGLQAMPENPGKACAQISKMIKGQDPSVP